MISDSHVGARRREPPRGLWEIVDSADRVIHLGDFTTVEFADMLALRAPLTAVAGNCDGAAIGARFPSAATIGLDGVKAAISHRPPFVRGGARKAARGMRERGVSLCLYGHTHRLADFEENGVRFINPGTAGGWPMPAGAPTAGILEIEGGRIQWRVVKLGRNE